MRKSRFSEKQIIRIASFVQPRVFLVVTLLLLTNSLESHALEVAVLPTTAVGRCAGAYFEAFETGDRDAMLAFVERYRSPTFLELHPVDERLEHQRRLRAFFGVLHPIRVTLSLEHQLTLIVDPEDRDDVVVMRFQLDQEAPGSLEFVTMSGIDHSDVGDDFVAYVANRAAPVDSALRTRTVESVAHQLRTEYVDLVLGQHMAGILLRNQAEGEYAELRKAGQLADRLTEDIRAVSHDLHLWVEAQNPRAQASTDPVNRDVNALRAARYDVREPEVLDGNVGVLKVDMIHDDEEALAITAQALVELSECDALILDLRENIGGEWGTAGMILRYLLPPGTRLARVLDREGQIVETRSVPESIVAESFGNDVPVYVLTSTETGSAAEALAYHLKHQGRATIVGETTKGAAHPSREVVVEGSFRMSIPFLRSESTVTGTDWEAVGVIPQVEVKAQDALDAASALARRCIADRPLPK